ncbi:type I restriction-modification enzyme R subunit C-terminal domain-containing protein [Rubritalea tangerina]|uniref:type I restriction-modification enzyme R subunit C-terminal domain-containing protein n=1 Tax=Rubritalea tangerina TaxID=430798 RepID=UPI0036237F28
MTGAQYEKKVRASLQQNLDRIEIKKLREGKPLTPQDVEQLQNMLVQLGDTAGSQLLDEMLVRNEAPNLLLFIRSCVGMSREAALKHFSSYLDSQSFSSTQIRFVELIVSQLTANGVVSAAALYEMPFTSIHAEGPDAVSLTQMS